MELSLKQSQEKRVTERLFSARLKSSHKHYSKQLLLLHCFNTTRYKVIIRSEKDQLKLLTDCLNTTQKAVNMHINKTTSGYITTI